MIDRNFKKKCIIVIYNESEKKVGVANSLREAKSIVYAQPRESQYYVCQISIEDAEVINQWIFKYMKGGVIFTKKVYSKWEELKREAKNKELTIDF